MIFNDDYEAIEKEIGKEIIKEVIDRIQKIRSENDAKKEESNKYIEVDILNAD